METLKASQICYLEKYRIYETFRNLVKALVMYRPRDHLRFIEWYLKQRRYVDVPKIILVVPPRYTDKVHVALSIAKAIGVVTIDRRNVLQRHRRKRGECSTDFTDSLIEYMKAKGTLKKGWILLDIPKNKNEADAIISVGILPTHTIMLNIAASDGDEIKLNMSNGYDKNFEFEMKTKFQSSLIEHNVYNKSIDEITDLCLEQISYQKPSTAPFVPRIVLIGPRGSKCFVTANEISKSLNLVHVNLEQILIQKKIGKGDGIPQETIRAWLKEKITTRDCTVKGYVLTGFPRTRNDFEWLDSIEIAPNRVIFLAIDIRDVYKRLINRCINKKTGTLMTLDQAVVDIKLGTLKLEHLSPYPLELKNFYNEYETYCDNLKEMLYYCGNNCFVVAVDESLDDKILKCVMSGSPATGPRPQNRKPFLLTKNLYEKMLVPYKDTCQKSQLSENSQNLLKALIHRSKQDIVS